MPIMQMHSQAISISTYPHHRSQRRSERLLSIHRLIRLPLDLDLALHGRHDGRAQPLVGRALGQGLHVVEHDDVRDHHLLKGKRVSFGLPYFEHRCRDVMRLPSIHAAPRNAPDKRAYRARK